MKGMENRPVGLHEYEGRNRLVDERFRRDKERLEKYEAAMESVQRLTVQMGEMIKRHDERLSSHESRIASLERQPADSWGKVKTAVITAVVSGVGGYLLNALLNTPK